MNERHVRLIGWLMPGACMSIAAFLFLGQSGRLHEATAARDKAGTLLDQAMANRATALTSEKRKLVAVAEGNSDEETAFLTDLRRRVAESGAKILKWTSATRPAGEPAKGDAEVDPVLRDVSAVQSELTLGGGFKNLCALLQDLDHANRLFTLSNITWSRSHDDGTTLTCTLTRYTRPANADAAKTPNS